MLAALWCAGAKKSFIKITMHVIIVPNLSFEAFEIDDLGKVYIVESSDFSGTKIE